MMLKNQISIFVLKNPSLAFVYELLSPLSISIMSSDQDAVLDGSEFNYCAVYIITEIKNIEDVASICLKINEKNDGLKPSIIYYLGVDEKFSIDELLNQGVSDVFVSTLNRRLLYSRISSFIEIFKFQYEKEMQNLDRIKNVENKIECILEALNKTAIVAETDTNGIIQYVNKSFLEISKYSESELIGKTHEVVRSGYHSSEFMKQLWKTIKSGEVWRGEIKNKAKDGSDYWVDTAIAPIFRSDGSIIKFIAIRFDITERKRLHDELMFESQAHQESLAVLGQLAATVAHEINNPLAAISMFTQMMESEIEEDSPFQEHIQIIKRNTASCKKTIQSLLNHSHRSNSEMEVISINSILEDVSVFIQPLCDKESIDFVKTLPEPSVEVLCDQVQLRQVFVNLLMNAIQSIVDKEGELIFKSYVSDDKARMIVEVMDNGDKIPVDFKEKIFEPFFTTKELGKGTGLGLPTSKRVIIAHGGILDLVHSNDTETLFKVELPIHKE